MNDTNRMLLAVLLSVGIIFLWQKFYVYPRNEEYRAANAAFLEQQELLNSTQDTAQNQQNNSSNLHTANTNIAELLPREAVLSNGNVERIAIKTAELDGSILLKGARFDDLTLLKYRTTLDEESDPVALLSPVGSNNVYFAEIGWLAAAKHVTVPDSNTIWSSDSTQLTTENPVTLWWNNGAGLKFIRKISIDENYMFSIIDRVENNSSNDISLTPYGRINRIRDDAQSIYISHEGPVGVFDNVLEEFTYDDIQDEAQKFSGKNFWIAIADKYWMTALIPTRGQEMSASMQHHNKNNKHRYQIDFKGQSKIIAANSTIEQTQHIFAGAKRVGVLNKYTKELSIPLFDRAVDFGWLYFITKPMLALLQFFNGLTGNFGVAILLMTMVIKGLMFPFANKSYKSMANMRVFMPEMKAIKERYKDDKLKMNQEMMAFYKTHSINPMSGCMPMLIQIPIFFSLYKVLYITIEMRHAPFFGWLRDLSAPDPTNIFNIFGLLPFTPPTFLPVIGILPILFAVSMFLQQKLNPPPTDPTQAMVMKWLPVIFLFIFAGFPAGLVLYWVWNNILSIIQQYVISKDVTK